MTPKDPTKPTFKQRATNELKDFAWIAFYLAFFFCALSFYATVLLRKYEIDYLNYSLAIINALVVAKVIMIGEMARLGKWGEAKPLYQSVIYKSVVFTLLLLAFHFLEAFVKRLIHHGASGSVLREANVPDLLSRMLIIFCAFIPLFAFRELGRLLGEEKLHELFFKSGGTASSTAPGRAAEI
jgi:hypothetical protein